MDEHGDAPGQGVPELCDLCGTVISEATELVALVQDSSAVHAHDAAFDGWRLVTACTQEHLRELVEQYRQRPFVEAEQWAGKIMRAVAGSHGRRVDDDDVLCELTGLTVQQIHAGVAWHNDRARAMRTARTDDPPR